MEYVEHSTRKYKIAIVISFLFGILISFFLFWPLQKEEKKHYEPIVKITPNTTPIKTFVIEVHENKFSPEFITIEKGNKIEWINRGGTHELVCVDHQGNPLEFNVLFLNVNDSFEWFFNRLGKFICFDATIGPEINVTIEVS